MAEAEETDGALLARLGTDGAKWAAAFVAAWQQLAFTNQGRGILADPSPGGFLHGWFCNAIEAGRSAPRDGLAGSDEAVEALVEAAAKAEYESAARGFTWEHDAPAETQRQLRGMLGPTVALVAARVRAEAVAEERQRLADAILPDHWQTTETWGGVRRLVCGRCRHGDGVRFLWPCRTRRAITGEPEPEPDSTLLAAGSVPVATPEQEVGGAGLIAAERRRQVEEEGWTLGHDAEHRGWELSMAAVSYATPASRREVRGVGPSATERVPVPWSWPWHARYWKPSPNDRVRELVKAGALIAAEIDRLLGLRVATPAEPAAKCPAGGHHAWVVVVEDERRCLNCDAKEPLEAAAEPSVGTGTDDESLNPEARPGADEPAGALPPRYQAMLARLRAAVLAAIKQ